MKRLFAGTVPPKSEEIFSRYSPAKSEEVTGTNSPTKKYEEVNGRYRSTKKIVMRLLVGTVPQKKKGRGYS